MKIVATFHGGRVRGSDRVVRVDGVLLKPGPSLRVRNHSPTGFAWGYGGSGPAQLALAILLRAGLPRARVLRLYQRFKWAYIARQPVGEGWTLDLDVVAWAREVDRDERTHGDE